jgi:hypothetical protein
MSISSNGLVRQGNRDYNFFVFLRLAHSSGVGRKKNPHEYQPAEGSRVSQEINEGAEVADPLIPRLIGDANGRFEDRDSLPARPDKNFYLKLETPGTDAEVHGLGQRIEAYSALGVADRRAAGQPDPEI